jgi:CHRD domain-containing protein
VKKLWMSAGLGVLLSAFLVVAVATAGDDHDDFNAKLKGFSEVPSVSTGAEGRFTAEVNGDEIEYRLSYSGLEGGPVLFAHIHFGQKDVNGGVAAFLCGGDGKPACPQSGEVRGTVTASDIVGPSGQGIAAASPAGPGEIDELIDAMDSDKTYANVHSEKFPTGEIRGQIREDD